MTRRFRWLLVAVLAAVVLVTAGFVAVRWTPDARNCRPSGAPIVNAARILSTTEPQVERHVTTLSAASDDASAEKNGVPYWSS